MDVLFVRQVEIGVPGQATSLGGNCSFQGELPLFEQGPVQERNPAGAARDVLGRQIAYLEAEVLVCGLEIIEIDRFGIEARGVVPVRLLVFEHGPGCPFHPAPAQASGNIHLLALDQMVALEGRDHVGIVLGGTVVAGREVVAQGNGQFAPRDQGQDDPVGDGIGVRLGLETAEGCAAVDAGLMHQVGRAFRDEQHLPCRNEVPVEVLQAGGARQARSLDGHQGQPQCDDLYVLLRHTVSLNGYDGSVTLARVDHKIKNHFHISIVQKAWSIFLKNFALRIFDIPRGCLGIMPRGSPWSGP